MTDATTAQVEHDGVRGRVIAGLADDLDRSTGGGRRERDP